MAVYTHLSADTLAALVAQYDIGTLRSAKGIAEGVSNSNWLVETTRDRFILTMYERRIALHDLPYFLGLLDHLSAKGCAVPRTIHDRTGAAYRMVDDKAVALIDFLPGVSIDVPTPVQARNVGAVLAQIHKACGDFAPIRANDLRPADWAALFGECGPAGLRAIDPALPAIVADAMPAIQRSWPEDLPTGTIHADLFPDNVLMLGEAVSGLIDFYFACTDTLAYDLAVTHAAWCFSPDGTGYRADVGAALLRGYASQRAVSAAEIAALPVLAQGAALRFMATRCVDWLETAPENAGTALVQRKDPMDFARRLQFYASHGDTAFASEHFCT